MQISIIAVGKINEAFLKEGIEEFIKRLSRFSKISIVETTEEKLPPNLSEKEKDKIKEVEGKRILEKIPAGSYVIALHVFGKHYSSEEMAELLEKLRLDGKSRISFLVGGTLGLSEEVLGKTDLVISFGKMTFPHQMIRLILLEQIYRSFKIISGEPYHR